MRALAAFEIGLAALSWSCAYTPPPVVMNASPASLEELAGEWRGDYSSRGGGRGGSIAFELVAGEDHAHGDVLMIPAGSTGSYEPYSMARPSARDREPGRAPQLLTIRFARVVNGGVTGTLAPYWDPDRRCAAWATFQGHIDGDTIAGTFRSVCEGDATPMTGAWRVDRRMTRDR